MILITNTKLYYKEYQTSKKELLDDSQFIQYLSDYVEFSDDLTFERLFNLIIQHSKIINDIFSTALGHYKIEDYIEDFKQEPKHPKIYYLKITPISDYCDNELHVYYDFGGFDDEENIAYGLSLSSISDYKQCNIKINDEFQIEDYDKETKIILKAKYTNIRLFDILYTILDEISWHGTPDDKNEVSNHLSEKGKEIEKAIENGTLSEIAEPIEKFQIELNNKFIEDAIDDEDYEEAERLRKENEEFQKILDDRKKEI